MTARLVRVAGPTVAVTGLPGVALNEVVYIGQERLLGEVIRIEGGVATVQVYEETAGLALGEPAEATGEALSVELGPGLLGRVFDGVQRPLSELAERQGDFLGRGVRHPRARPRAALGLRAVGRAGRSPPRRRSRRHGPRRRRGAPRARAPRRRGPGRGGASGARDGGDAGGRARGGRRRRPRAALARAAPASGEAPDRGGRAVPHRAASPRLLLPGLRRRDRHGAGRLRDREDDPRAEPREVGRRRRGRVRRVRRARQRDGRGDRRVPEARSIRAPAARSSPARCSW